VLTTRIRSWLCFSFLPKENVAQLDLKKRVILLKHIHKPFTILLFFLRKSFAILLFFLGKTQPSSSYLTFLPKEAFCYLTFLPREDAAQLDLLFFLGKTQPSSSYLTFLPKEAFCYFTFLPKEDAAQLDLKKKDAAQLEGFELENLECTPVCLPLGYVHGCVLVRHFCYLYIKSRLSYLDRCSPAYLNCTHSATPPLLSLIDAREVK
jgi:hypothetical protein